MKAWLKKHDRKLWWGLLIGSVIIGQIRGPQCNYGPHAVYLWAPTLIIVVVFAALWWSLLRLRKDR